jgi:carboxymethylenebutenolidase
MSSQAQKSERAFEVVETDVEIRTSDGICDAAFLRPSAGAHAGVLVWPDAGGLRPSLRDIGRQVASAGYSVLVPNPFYRITKAPALDFAHFDFHNPADREKLRPLMGSVGAQGSAEKDTVAYAGFLDSRQEVDKARKLGVQGYCMGGRLMMRSAAVLGERMGAGASFHGGGLVTDQPDSPHLLAPKIKARLYFGVAANDDDREPEAKDTLKAAFEAAHVSAEIEVYPGTSHGWCIPDMPTEDGRPIYDPAAAERAFGKLMALYGQGLR